MGYAPEYVDGMWRILQQEKPEDFVLATGTQHSVREFVELSFQELGITIVWKGKNENEIGINGITGKTIIEVSPKYYRPNEVEALLGDASKAKNLLGWETKTSFEDLVKTMVQADWERVKNGGF